jgi:hypothetical protein
MELTMIQASRSAEDVACLRRRVVVLQKWLPQQPQQPLLQNLH